MATKNEALRRPGRAGRLPELPPITAFQFMLLWMIMTTGRDAYGLAMLVRLNETLSKEIDQAQVYMTLNRMGRRGLIRVREHRELAGSPPLKVWELTPTGGSAIDSYVAFNKAVLTMTTTTTRS